MIDRFVPCQSINQRSSPSHTRAEEKPHPSTTTGGANPASQSPVSPLRCCIRARGVCGPSAMSETAVMQTFRPIRHYSHAPNTHAQRAGTCTPMAYGLSLPCAVNPRVKPTVTPLQAAYRLQAGQLPTLVSALLCPHLQYCYLRLECEILLAQSEMRGAAQSINQGPAPAPHTCTEKLYLSSFPSKTTADRAARSDTGYHLRV